MTWVNRIVNDAERLEQSCLSVKVMPFTWFETDTITVVSPLGNCIVSVSMFAAPI